MHIIMYIYLYIYMYVYSLIIIDKHYTLNSAYNEKKYAEILLRYRQLFIKDDIFIGEMSIFGAEVFLNYR